MADLSFEKMFVRRNPDHAFLLKRMRCAFDVEEVTFEDINSTNLRSLREYLEDDVHNGTLKTYLGIVAATVKEFASDGLCRPINFKTLYKVKADKTENIALTEEEVDLFVKRFNHIKNEPSVERDVLTLFLLECFTGARSSDVGKFTLDSVSDNMLTYVSQKTHTLTRVPIHRMLPTLLEYLPKKKYLRMTPCRKIKQIAKHLGINKPEKRMFHGELKTRPRYEYIATHTARRTFITLLLDKGVPLATVSKLAGHSSTSMTLRYYCSDKLVLNEAAMSFFQ